MWKEVRSLLKSLVFLYPRAKVLIKSSEEGTFECMKAAYDCGVNFFDCAEGYADGESEVVMGEAIKKYAWKRNDLVVSTKVSNCFTVLDPFQSDYHSQTSQTSCTGVVLLVTKL